MGVSFVNHWEEVVSMSAAPPPSGLDPCFFSYANKVYPCNCADQKYFGEAGKINTIILDCTTRGCTNAPYPLYSPDYPPCIFDNAPEAIMLKNNSTAGTSLSFVPVGFDASHAFVLAPGEQVLLGGGQTVPANSWNIFYGGAPVAAFQTKNLLLKRGTTTLYPPAGFYPSGASLSKTIERILDNFAATFFD
jgi:hypothetical protein